MLNVLLSVVLGILLGLFTALVTTNPWGLHSIQRCTLALSFFLAAICIAHNIYTNKPENKQPHRFGFHFFQLVTGGLSAVFFVIFIVHTTYTDKPSPKPVLHWQAYNGHPAITSESFKVGTAEASSTLSLFLQNEGNANLTQGTLYIEHESGYEVVADKHWEMISTELEKEVRGISIGLPTIRPAPAEPFRFNLTINPRVGGSSVPNWTITSVMKLYIKVDAAEIPNGLKFHELEVTHR
jgi:hypothetical protein